MTSLSENFKVAQQKMGRRRQAIKVLAALLSAPAVSARGAASLEQEDPFSYANIRPASFASRVVEKSAEPVFGPFHSRSAAGERKKGQDDAALHLFTRYILQDLSANNSYSSGYVESGQEHYGMWYMHPGAGRSKLKFYAPD